MKKIGLFFGGLLAALSLSGVPAWSAADVPVLIRGIDVYPVTGPVMKSVSVLVENGKIAGVGARIAAPKGARVIEGKGLRVYPGMIDSATQLGLSEIESIRETVDTGELGEFMPQLRALASVNPGSEHFPVVRVNGITTAMTFPSGGGGGGRGAAARQVISGQAALIHTDGWTWEQMAVLPSAAIAVQFPSLGGRGGRGGGNPDFPALFGEAGAAGAYAQTLRTYREELGKLTDFFDQARRYQKAKAANEPGLTRDLKYEALIPVLEGKTPLAISVSTPKTIHDAIAFADRQHVKVVLLQPRELGNAAAELKARNIPVILGKVLALPHGEDDPYDQAFTLPLECYKAGVKFAFGAFENQFVRDLPYQAATAVAFGLPQEQALKAITINPAEIWGVSDQVGSIEKGKVADLVVTTGDILEIQTQVKHVFIKGQDVDLTNKQTRLYEKYLARP
ncbi:MAG: amidohydrolase family protein [Bryobacteraceae bacterium]